VIEWLRQPGSVAMPKYPYEVVADTIRARIQDGIYPPGSKLPSRSKLCEEFGVSDIVVGAAMRVLKGERLTETLPGIGVFVAGDPPLSAPSVHPEE
jgi:GntR family transcriptional regulator